MRTARGRTRRRRWLLGERGRRRLGLRSGWRIRCPPTGAPDFFTLVPLRRVFRSRQTVWRGHAGALCVRERRPGTFEAKVKYAFSGLTLLRPRAKSRTSGSSKAYVSPSTSASRSWASRTAALTPSIKFVSPLSSMQPRGSFCPMCLQRARTALTCWPAWPKRSAADWNLPSWASASTASENLPI